MRSESTAAMTDDKLPMPSSHPFKTGKLPRTLSRKRRIILHNSRSTLDFAFNYSQLGYAVFPCIPNGKRPLTKHGLQDASSCPKQIKDWWQRWPLANLAVLPPEDVLVLDFDDRTIAETWLQIYPELKQVPQTRTPRGGLHCWLRLRKDVNPEDLKTRAKAAEGEVDLRGLGRAYLIAPPSRTADGYYSWGQSLGPTTHLPYARVAVFLKLSLRPQPEK